MTRRNRIVSVIVAVALAALVLFPFLDVFSGALVRTVTVVVMAAATAQAWNLIGGYTGYPAFGNVAFFGVGGYAVAILMSKLHVDFIPAVLAGGLVAALYATLLGLPILRLKGHYFSIATLGVAEATREVVSNWTALTGGGSGITLPISPDIPPIFNRAMYFSMLAVFVGSVILTYGVTRSKLGYGLIAIREDEDAARSLGINTTRFKVTAFALSALVTGLAGGVYAYWNSQLIPEDAFSLDITLRAILISIIGGPGTLFGPALGAVAFEFMRNYLWDNFPGLQFTFLGLVMVLVIIFMPKGVMEFLTGRRRFTASALLQYVRQNRVS
ncbi:MAG: branched-chain amino acid ABC transporter permease [Chloroflexi bacterium]|nr:branched-chain amino acid ABC transporter permease [Chloroflexota bacterium]